jgi:hypothetical protein
VNAFECTNCEVQKYASFCECNGFKCTGCYKNTFYPPSCLPDCEKDPDLCKDFVFLNYNFFVDI